MGATYDPHFLRRYHLWTQRADPIEARRWYRRALDLGASEAGPRLDSLKAAPP
jgi:TPR repeat protein